MDEVVGVAVLAAMEEPCIRQSLNVKLEDKARLFAEHSDKVKALEIAMRRRHFRLARLQLT